VLLRAFLLRKKKFKKFEVSNIGQVSEKLLAVLKQNNTTCAGTSVTDTWKHNVCTSVCVPAASLLFSNKDISSCHNSHIDCLLSPFL
jgi:hypothetical protein